jgi:hypothetical protein
VSSIADEVAALRGTRPATLKDLVTHPPFARLLAAMTVSSLGDWVGFIAVTSIVARLGAEQAAGLAISGVMIARTLPAFVFGPIAGALVDRMDRKRLMIVADLARGAMYVSMVFLSELWAIYLLSFAIECLSLLWGPARDASLPNLVPRRQLANANSLSSCRRGWASGSSSSAPNRSHSPSCSTPAPSCSRRRWSAGSRSGPRRAGRRSAWIRRGSGTTRATGSGSFARIRWLRR